MPPRGRKTNRQSFLDVLLKLSNNGEKLVSNANMQAQLNWDDVKYKSVKEELLISGLIVKGRGAGGTVGMVPQDESVDVFISYSHADEEMKDMLLKHLEPLRRMGLVKTWHDRKILAGKEFDKEIKGKLEKSKIVLLLISIDFINSDYCYDVELERALELHAAGKVVVVPVIVRECLWKHAPFSKIMALPKDGVAVTAHPDRDKAFMMVAEGIMDIARGLSVKL